MAKKAAGAATCASRSMGERLRPAVAEAEPLARAALDGGTPDLVAHAALLLGHAAPARNDTTQAAKWFEYAARTAPQSKSGADARAALQRLGRS